MSQPCPTVAIDASPATMRKRDFVSVARLRKFAGHFLIVLTTCTSATLFVTATPQAVVAQQQADVIRGRVTGPDNKPIVNVQVTTVSFIGGISRNKRTDKDGRFSITYPNGEGDYWISYSAIGYTAQRFEIKRSADEEILIADVKLSNTQTLQAVTVTASGPRQTPGRIDYSGNDISGTDRYVSTGGIDPQLAGNLAAMAANTPGVQLIPGVDGNADMFSILGLDGSQNNGALNGQQNGLSNIPRDAQVSTTLRAGYDVANGGFSGAQVNVSTQSGSNYISRAMSGVFNAPQAQFNDRVGQASEYSYISLGGRASGPILTDKDFYTFSFQFDRRSQNLATLLSTTPVVFQSAGISTDSVARLRTILNNIGVPISTGSIGNNSARTNASLLGGIDWAPKSQNSGHAFNLSYNGGFSSTGPQATATSQTPASLGESQSLNGSAQLRHTNFFGSVLTESMLSASGSRNKTNPFLELPSGTVLVTSTLDDGTATARSLIFGGSANANTNSSVSAAGRNMLSWFSANNKHRLKLISELRIDRSSSERASNLLGRYTYQSLADLEAGKPSSFSRSLNAVNQNGSGLVGALAFGDAWRPSKDVQVQYGVRLDGNRFLTRPAENAAIESAFGVSNNEVPNGVYVSPRLGFSWLYGKASQIPYAEGFVTGPRATIRGGIGIFQNVRGPDLATGAIANT
ncbi:MAG: carboxypeptidase-like regulatory domain-containing protein, partial [Gemmatimonas sp.]